MRENQGGKKRKREGGEERKREKQNTSESKEEIGRRRGRDRLID